MDPQQLADLMCELRQIARSLPLAKCNPDGTASIPLAGSASCSQAEVPIERLIALQTLLNTQDITVDVGDITISTPAPDPRPASFSGELLTVDASGNVPDGTIPANTYSVTVFNDTCVTIRVDIGGDFQIVPPGASHNFWRDFDREQPFAAGPAAVTEVGGNAVEGEYVIFDYKRIV